MLLQRRPELLESSREEGAFRVLHIAPERGIGAILRSTPGARYLSGDVEPGRAMATVDVTDIEQPDAAFDLVWCSHVLEHVEEDRRAMREFRRVLARGGRAVIGVPITVETTFEDPAVVDPADRLRLFGQEDHVRRYGMDVVERLAEAGFRVEVVRPSDLASPEEADRFRLPGDDQPLFVCRQEES